MADNNLEFIITADNNLELWKKIVRQDLLDLEIFIVIAS